MKACLVFLAIFLAITSAKQSFGWGYVPGEGGSALEKSGDISDSEGEKNTQWQTLPGQPQQKIAKKSQPNSSGQYSENVNGYEIRSSNPITILPQSSGGTITVQGNGTVVQPNSSGGIQAVGNDISVIPTK